MESVDGIIFTSEQDLYKRVRPALVAKKKELQRLGFSYIREQDIWNYLRAVKWIKSKDLMLADVVSDILHLDNNRIDQYVKKEWEKHSCENDIEII